MPETVLDLGRKVKSKYPGAYDDLSDAEVGQKVKSKFPGAYDDFTDVEAPQPQASASKPNLTQSPEYQSLIGATPTDLVERVKGFARSVGKVGMGALQYGQYLTGSKVSPTPLSLEPSPDPNQAVGEKIGNLALTMAPGSLASKASLPVRAAIDSAVGGMQGGPAGAVIGGAVPVAGDLGKEAGAALLKRVDTARMFNQAAGVPAGRRGVEVSMSTGQIKTNPGNAPLRALDDKGAGLLDKVKAAGFARATPELASNISGELDTAGKAIEAHLAPSKAMIPIQLPAVPKAAQAAAEAGITGQTVVSPLQAHQLRSALGSRINWNPMAMPTEANEAMKDAWMELGDKIQATTPGIAPLNKRWQEAYLYSRALKHQLELAASGKSVPYSAVQRGAITAAKAAGIGGGLLAAGKGIERLAGQ